MAIFESNILQVSSPGTVSTLIWNPNNTSATTFGALGSVPSTAILKDVTIVNQGTCNVYVGAGSAAVATALGFMIPVGGQLTLQGYYATGGTTLNPIWGNVGTVGYTGAVAVGLSSVASVV